MTLEEEIREHFRKKDEECRQAIASEFKAMRDAGFDTKYVNDNTRYFECFRCASIVTDWRKHGERCK